jgi:hypothetical protein
MTTTIVTKETELFGMGFIGIENTTVHVHVNARLPHENEKEAKRRQFTEAKSKLFSSGAEAAKLFPL